ncbi:2-dehydropantoate 2-reductase [Paenibacillus sp. FSL H8-0537]|uniref:ketopantoate reductase family protein n=1 Tax=Paenibacillus sp. FSL H8-0537 TaxID=2921399 RepID=UPI00310192A0
MHIAIVGGGALGLLHAAKLASTEAEVTVWTRTEHQSALLADEGIRLLELDEAGGAREASPQPAKIAKVHSRSLSAAAAEAEAEAGCVGQQQAPDWIIVTVKQADLTRELLRAIGKLAAPAAAILFLQNGIGHLELAAQELPALPLFIGVTTEGALRQDERTVRHTGRGQLALGLASLNRQAAGKKDENQQIMLQNALQLAGFTVLLSKTMNNRVYEKLLINAIINPLTAIFDVTNGELPQHSARLRLMRALYEETNEILRVAGGAELGEGAWERVLAVCEATSANVSSMLSDVRAGRPTEVQWINGGVSSLARRGGMESPLNDAMSEMVRHLQDDRL